MEFWVYRGIGTSNGFTIYLQNHVRNWPFDMTITDNNGNVMPYTIEKYDSNSAVIWVNMSYLPASPNTTSITFYYGLNNGVGDSSANNVFPLYDGFTGTSLNSTLWNTAGGPTINVSGGTAAIIAAALPVGDRTLHLFDRWGDLPEPSAADGPQQQRYAKANIPDKLQDLIDRPPLAATQDIMTRTWRGPVRYYQGWFDETLPTYDGRPFAFAFVDCDYYNSVKPVLEFIIANAAPGCVIVVDDYVGDWVGAKRAVDELGRPVETVLSQAIIRL
jgi:hypothetical protein